MSPLTLAPFPPTTIVSNFVHLADHCGRLGHDHGPDNKQLSLSAANSILRLMNSNSVP